MIALVRGRLTDRTGDLVTVYTEGGVGYDIAVPMAVLEQLPPIGSVVELHTVLVVREDDWSLYGFDSPAARVVFKRLMGASGVGPRLALALISALGADRVIQAVREDDIDILCTVPGVGKKKAERMVLELRDRIRDLAIRSEATGPTPATTQAVAALTSLGYAHQEADAAVRSVLAESGTLDTSELIRQALHRAAQRT